MFGLVLVLAAQTAWAVATTSGTYDETTYLRFGRGYYGSLDAKPFADWGVAPLPVLLTSAAPVAAGAEPYPHAVTLARVSAIVFFGVPLTALTYWTLLRAAGPVAALAGTAIVVLSPNIVAHASLATSDACFLAAALAALAALAYDLERRSRRSRVVLGVTLAIALAAKYSALSLFVVVGIAAFAASGSERRSVAGRAASAAALTAGLFAVSLMFVWALHAFAMTPFGLPPVDEVRMPAPIVGIARQLHHQTLGEPAFLLGRRSTSGWWYFMPVAMAIKSTPAELAVGACALGLLLRSWRGVTPSGLVWRIAFVVFAVSGLTNRLALGVRYMLLLIPLAVFLASEWWFVRERERRRTLLVAGALVASQALSAASIAPHDLSYVNAFAGGPSKGYLELADSNVDWGQDLPALKGTLTRLGAQHPLLSYFGTAPPEAYGIRADRWDATVRAPFDRWDWVAISATHLEGLFVERDPFEDFRALAPAARAGYSILLYPTNRPDVRRAMATAAGRLP